VFVVVVVVVVYFVIDSVRKLVDTPPYVPLLKQLVLSVLPFRHGREIWVSNNRKLSEMQMAEIRFKR